MKQSNAEEMVARLMSNAATVRYGSVSVTAKLHDGRVVEISFSTSEQTREKKNEELGMRNEICRKTSYLA